VRFFAGSTLLITGGTGSFGTALVKHLLASEDCPQRICILSRDELKQARMRTDLHDDFRLRFWIGDVRDRERLRLAFRAVTHVVHAAAMKRVEVCHANPFEAKATNIDGTENVLRAALDSNVKRVVCISSDKACAPLNEYGKTKAFLEDMVLHANVYSGKAGPMFSVVRYGNVSGSRGSVIPLWRAALAAGEPIRILDPQATRFWFTLDGAVDLVLWTLKTMQGGELIVPKLPSFHIPDLAEALAPGHPVEYGCPRVGDKTHEAMVSADEAPWFRAVNGHLVRFQREPYGDSLPAGFSYTSDQNTQWLDVEGLRDALRSV